MSLLSCDKLYDIHRRLQDIFVSLDLFGGRAVLLVGDLLQLPPVMASPIYSKPTSRKNKSLWNSSDNLWDSFEPVVLQTNFRQGNHNIWTECLNRIRVGEANEEDLKLLETRRINLHPNHCLKEASHVCATNLEITMINTKKMNDLKGPLVTIEATVVHQKGYRPTISPFGTVDDTHFMEKLQVRIGARVMLVFNVSIADSLVNGALGTILDVIFSDNNEVNAIIIAFDNPEVGMEQRRQFKAICEKYSSQNGCPIFRSKLQYSVPYKKSSRLHGTKCQVIQFPLKLAWACTAHKMQGVTIKSGNDLIIHGNKKIKPSMYYVMLSRCANIENVFIDKNFDSKGLTCHQKSLQENINLDDRSIVNKYQDMEHDIYMVNVRSLPKHFNDLLCDMHAMSSSHICLVESWLAESQEKDFEIENRTFHCASFGKGKGCCVYSKKSQKACLLHKHSGNNFQLLSLAIQNQIQLSVLYLSRGCSYKAVVDILVAVQRIDLEQVIVGDLNFDKDESNLLSEYLQSQGLIQMIQQPTHSEGRTIDHYYVSQPMSLISEVLIISPYFTDHSAICIRLRNK